jgi:hypothetical protein
MTREDYLSENTKAKVKDFEKKLGECLDDSNFILESEDDIDLKKYLRILMMTALVQL